MKVTVSTVALASMVFDPVNGAAERTMSLRGTGNKHMSSDILVEYEDKSRGIILEEIDDALEHNRLLSDGADCSIFSDDEYWTWDAGYCSDLGGTWWNDRVTHIRGSDTTTVYAYENHMDQDNGGQVIESSGSDWKDLQGTNLYRQVSRVCCLTTTSNTPQQYTLDLSTETDVDASILDNIKNTFYDYYPSMAQKYNPSARSAVKIIVHEFDWDGVPAYASNGEIHLKTSAVIGNPIDMSFGCVIHESTHIVQDGWKNVPGHFIEGFADFVRDETGIDAAHGNSWAIPLGYQPGQQYTDGYGTTAAFIKWMIGNGLLSLESLIGVFLDGSYSDDTTWPALTGTSLDDLWNRYSNS